MSQGTFRSNPGFNQPRNIGGATNQGGVRPRANMNPNVNNFRGGTPPGVTSQRPVVPNLNRIPSTTLRNNLDAAVQGNFGANPRGNIRPDGGRGQVRGDLNTSNSAAIGRSSPQHPQNRNNWGRNWNQYGVRPSYRNWGYQGAWSGFDGPRWYSGYGPRSFGQNNRFGVGVGSGFGLGFGGLGLGYGGYGQGGYGYGAGLFGQNGLGYGLNPWLLNSAGYRWGYNSYSNPYVGNLGGFPYNYAQPVYVTSYLAESESPEDSIQRGLDAARESFRAGDYERALTWIDNVIKASPSDTPAHEFRALTLFALRRYEEAAATLNALLAVAPGWNWATMVGFYPHVDIYTQQLRGLEAFLREHPDSAASQFLLAYHYLVTGHADAAQRKLEEVVALEPRDEIARQLLQGLAADDETDPISTPVDSNLPAAERQPSADAMTELEGAFVAERKGGQRFELVLRKAGDFSWKATGEESREVTGRFDLEGNVIVLNGGRGDTLAATVTAEGPDDFHFKLLGAPAEDPGLIFRRNNP